MTRLLPVIAATLLIALAAASLAQAAPKTTFTIRGAGFGHGVGMSQYGAMGFAQQGRSAAEILAHYYSGTGLGTTDPNQAVRVMLVPQTKAARITGARQAGSRKLSPTSTYTIKRRGISELDLSANGRRLATFSAPLQVAGEGGITALSGHGRYRGVLEFAPNVFDGIQVINSVGLDAYLQGVVPAESPAYWPAEALKAQAITARTYAITTAKSADFDHYADTRSQVYKGVGIETAATNQAIADTRGQIVTYQGQPVVTYFFSTSGGRTESVENTNLGDEPKPWLKSVEDPYDDVSPRHRWTLKPSKASVAKKLGGLVKGSFKGIRVTQRGESPRIMTAEVVGSRGVTPTDGPTLRARLGLFDTWASFTAIKSEEGDASGGDERSALVLLHPPDGGRRAARDRDRPAARDAADRRRRRALTAGGRRARAHAPDGAYRWVARSTAARTGSSPTAQSDPSIRIG